VAKAWRRRDDRKGTGLTAAGNRLAKQGSHAVLAALFSALLASCTSTSDPNLDFSAPAYNASAATPSVTSDVEATGVAPAIAAAETTQASEAADPAASTVMDENDQSLPVAVAYLPTMRPVTGGTISLQQAVEAEAEAERMAAAQAAAAEPEAVAQAPLPSARPGEMAQTAEAKPAVQGTQTAQMAAPESEKAASAASAEPVATESEAPKKKGFFASLFGSSSSSSPAAAPSGRGAPSSAAKPLVATNTAAKPLIDTEKAEAETTSTPEAKPLIQLASADSSAKPLVMASAVGGTELPGVRTTELFEIKRKSGIDDDSDVDLHEEEDGGPVQLASAAGMARLAPNGLLRQTENVDVACLKPSLVRVLKTIEQHYGNKIIVTSGYRSPTHNRRSRGAKNSLHMYCAAADIQIPGVSKWELANYVRTMPGRGGVGTYCHTDSVHIDVGPERDWNWRCARRK